MIKISSKKTKETKTGRRKQLLAKYVVGFQGWYYFLTGLWALISLGSFNRIVGHQHLGEPFEMHSLAALSLILGLYFIFSVRKPLLTERRDVLFLVMGMAVAVAAVELVYLPGGGWNLFWVDMAEEILVAGVAVWLLRRRPIFAR